MITRIKKLKSDVEYMMWVLGVKGWLSALKDWPTYGARRIVVPAAEDAERKRDTM